MAKVIAVRSPLPPSFLEKNTPPKNLESLSNPKYSLSPTTSCMTREVYQKVPYLKCTSQAIHNFCIGFTTFLTVGNLLYQLTSGAVLCSTTKGDELDKNFFPIASDCLAQSFNQIIQPNSLTWLFFKSSAAVLAGVVASVAGRIFLYDYKGKTRFQLLDQEYSKVAQELVNTKDTSTVKNLQANLLLIESNLTQKAHLEPEQVKKLTKKLNIAIENVLNQRTDSWV